MDSFLKDNEDDRNVLFGRLLAVYDYMEQRALFEKDDNGKIKEMRNFTRRDRSSEIPHFLHLLS